MVVDPTTDEVTCGGDELSGTSLEYAALYCEDENIVVIDGDGLAGDLYSIGDFAVASELGQLWATGRAVPARRGRQRRCHPPGRLHDRVLGEPRRSPTSRT